MDHSTMILALPQQAIVETIVEVLRRNIVCAGGYSVRILSGYMVVVY